MGAWGGEVETRRGAGPEHKCKLHSIVIRVQGKRVRTCISMQTQKDSHKKIATTVLQESIVRLLQCIWTAFFLMLKSDDVSET